MDLILTHLDIVAGILELIGLILIGNKLKSAFILLLICNCIWISYVFVTGSTYGLLFICIPMLGVNGRNFLLWKKDDESN